MCETFLSRTLRKLRQRRLRRYRENIVLANEFDLDLPLETEWLSLGILANMCESLLSKFTRRQHRQGLVLNIDNRALLDEFDLDLPIEIVNNNHLIFTDL